MEYEFNKAKRIVKELNPLLWRERAIQRHIAFWGRQYGTWHGVTESDDIWPRSSQSKPLWGVWSDAQFAIYEKAVYERKAIWKEAQKILARLR